jgi:hypothetical protein
VAFQVNQPRDIEEVKEWQNDHDKTVETRAMENRTLRGQTEERLKSIELDATSSDRKQDQIEYRVTILESQSAAQAQKIDEKLSEFAGDMKVVKELLQRMEAERKRTLR